MSDDLIRLAADLSNAGAVTTEAARAVVAKGALNIKEDWRERASGLAHAPLYPMSISYETRVTRGFVEATIGPDKEKPQGALGNLIEFGSAHNAPHNDGGQALDAEEPRFVAAFEAIAEQIL